MVKCKEALKFVVPTKELEGQAIEYKHEHLLNGENELHGGALLEKMEYDKWLELVKKNMDKETVISDWVVSSTFFVVRESDEKIIGMVDIRHELNDFLRNYGGNIGYGVRPTERQKGYGVQILKKALEYSRNLKLDKVMLACYKDNSPSSKTILKCGGKLTKEFTHSDGKMVLVYWIKL